MSMLLQTLKILSVLDMLSQTARITSSYLG